MEHKFFFTDNHRHLTLFDLKAEVLFTYLLESNINDLEIVIKNKGLFYRKFRKDKMNVLLDAVNPDLINIELSRDGFYDVLPERITHQYSEDYTINDPVKEFKARRKEENEARHFFSPLENEMFRFRNDIERYEADFFSKLNTNKIVDIIKTILAVDDSIPDKYVIKMYYALLKYNHGKEQSIVKIIEILSDLIDEKVSYTSSNIKLDHTYDVEEKNNDLVLGINTTLETSQQIFLKKYHFSIGPLKKSPDLLNFFENQFMKTLIDTFFNILLPFHIQFSFQIELDREDELFTLNEKEFNGRLGISTLL
jgi:hypothetical protein